MKRQMHMEWEEEYYMMPIHFFFHLSLELTTWRISIEEEAGYIKLPRMLVIWFEFNHHNFGKMNIPTPASLATVAPSANLLYSIPIPSIPLAQFIAHSKIYHSGRTIWAPLSNITLPKQISLRQCIYYFLNVGETLPVLDNWIVMCLS